MRCGVRVDAVALTPPASVIAHKSHNADGPHPTAGVVAHKLHNVPSISREPGSDASTLAGGDRAL